MKEVSTEEVIDLTTLDVTLSYTQKGNSWQLWNQSEDYQKGT